MTHDESFKLFEEILNEYLPITPGTNNVEARRALRQAALICAWPADYTVPTARGLIKVIP